MNRDYEVPGLSHALAEILPSHVFLQLTLDMLNTKSFEPESKDEELRSGILQLPKGTLVLLSEHAIGEGTLNEKGKVIRLGDLNSQKRYLMELKLKGVNNVRALQEVASSRNLHYNFPFSRYTFKTEVTIVALTTGKKSLLLEVPHITYSRFSWEYLTIATLRPVLTYRFAQKKMAYSNQRRG